MPTIAADYMVGALVNARAKRVYGVVGDSRMQAADAMCARRRLSAAQDRQPFE